MPATVRPPTRIDRDRRAEPTSEETDTTPAAGARRPPRHRPGRRTLVTLTLAAALLGGVVGAGTIVLTGALGDDDAATSTTVVQSETSDASSSSLDANAIYQSASAGVVEITVTSAGAAQVDPFGQGSSESTATGSGFVVDSSGHIVTAAHVVDDADSVKITFSDGSIRTAKLVGQDDATDVAVLKVDPSGLDLHPLKLGNSASLDVGDAVVAIGSPFGYAESVSTGIVSGLDRTIEAPNGYTVAHAIQTDAAMNPGNSGGPILDSSGRVVGIADQIATSGSSEQSSGVGFAVPIDLVADELDELESGQTVSHAYLGVSTTDSTSTAGALVAEVSAGSPAASAEIEDGDIITAVDGEKITGTGDLVAAIADRNPGDQLELTVRRGSDSLTLTATLGTQPASQNASAG